MGIEMIETRHRAFSFGRVLAITANTLTDLTRQKVFYFVLIFAVLLIGSSVFMARLSFQQEFQILKDVALGAISILTSLLAIVATTRLISQDIEDRTVYTILAKPVPRIEYLLGKLAGVLLLLAIGTLVMGAVMFAVLYLREQTVLSQTWRQKRRACFRDEPRYCLGYRCHLPEGVPAGRSHPLCIYLRDNQYLHDCGHGFHLFYRPFASDRPRVLAAGTQRQLVNTDVSCHRRPHFPGPSSL